LPPIQTILEIALPLFLIMDPVANSTFCLALLKDYPARRQRAIIWRELVIALIVMISFSFLGGWLLDFLNIHQSTLKIAGGVILFMISIKLVFPSPHEPLEDAGGDPFIVPIAVPFIAGPSLLAAIMLYAHQPPGMAALLPGVGLAWVGTALIMVTAPSLTRVLGQRGMRAAERLMGLVLVLLSVQMLEDGVRMFIESL
jgi:multiple antibiotic resistance protein